MSNVHAKIAARIKVLLKEQGKSAEKLAFETGLSKSFLYRYLRGDVKAGVETLETVAKGLDVKLRDLFPA